MEKGLARKHRAINPLDVAFKNHDIAYTHDPNNLNTGHQTNLLEQAARERVKSKDTSVGDKTAAWFATTVIKGKQRRNRKNKNKSYCQKKKGAIEKKDF